jgi:protein gp37
MSKSRKDATASPQSVGGDMDALAGVATRNTTGIQWTHVPGYVGATWNPTVGCTRVSRGCDNCYAFTLHDQRHLAWKRGRYPDAPPQYHQPFSTVQMLDKKRLEQPLRAKAPHAYFVDSMADLFHEDVTDKFIDDVFDVMSVASQHIFMILTKRPERMRDLLRSWPGYRGASNVWLGVSAEDQMRADERIPLLLDTPAAVRFVSYEPALGPVDFRLVPIPIHGPRELATSRLDWIIVGGESGSRARPFDLAWARDVLKQCDGRPSAAAVFVKQLGAKPVETNPALGGMVGRTAYPLDKLVNRHGSDPAEWPEDLRVREWPVHS